MRVIADGVSSALFDEGVDALPHTKRWAGTGFHAAVDALPVQSDTYSFGQIVVCPTMGPMISPIENPLRQLGTDPARAERL
jgi:hypothetical protein